MKIILASKSPRRSQLLREAGFDFEVRAMETDENYPAEMPIEAVAAYVAQKKANALPLTQAEADQCVVLAADSIVVLDGKIFGKPSDRAEAVRMLSQLSGRMHEVFTGVCMRFAQQEVVFTGLSKVYFDVLKHDEINYYINNYKPFDKAGSYGVQDWIGLCKVHRIEGTYANVMGLPVDMVYRQMQSWRLL